MEGGPQGTEHSSFIYTIHFLVSYIFPKIFCMSLWEPPSMSSDIQEMCVHPFSSPVTQLRKWIATHKQRHWPSQLSALND